MAMAMAIAIGLFYISDMDPIDIFNFNSKTETSQTEHQTTRSADLEGGDSSPAPQRNSFDASRIRNSLAREVTIDKTIATTRPSNNASQRYVNWLNLTSVSIQSGTEIGYDYDVAISYQREAGIMRSGRLDEMLDSSPCKITLHVASDYRVAGNFLMQGEMSYTKHAGYFARVIERLR